MATVEEIEQAIRALSPDERIRLAHSLPALIPNWTAMFCGKPAYAIPRSAPHSLPRSMNWMRNLRAIPSGSVLCGSAISSCRGDLRARSWHAPEIKTAARTAYARFAENPAHPAFAWNASARIHVRGRASDARLSCGGTTLRG
jgi:hypothetical protein